MSRRIMVVDDSRRFRVQMEDALAGTEYEVAASCGSGEDAIDVFEQVRPDLVTMDIIMQGMDGLDAAEIILREHPEARIVMVSSLAYNDTISTAAAVGAKDFIFKPFDKEMLLDALQKALSGETVG